MENSKELSIPSSEEIEQIRQFTGEQSYQQVLKIPYLSFSGKNGMFSIQKEGKDSNGKSIFKEIGESFEGVIIRVRKSIKSPQDVVPSYYSSEFDSYNEPINLFRSDTRGIIDSGLYADLKNKYGEAVGLAENVYVYFEEKIYKIQVKGTSLNPLWVYLQSFPKDDTVLRYLTVFSSKEEINKAGQKYKVLVLKKGDVFGNWKMIWSELKNLDLALSKTATKKSELLEGRVISGEHFDNIPTIEVEEDFPNDDAEEVDVSKIPF